MKINVLQFLFKKVNKFKLKGLRGAKRRGKDPTHLMRCIQDKGEQGEAKTTWSKRRGNSGSKPASDLSPASPQTREPHPLLYGLMEPCGFPSSPSLSGWFLCVIIQFSSPSPLSIITAKTPPLCPPGYIEHM